MPITTAELSDVNGILENIQLCIQQMRITFGSSPWDEIYPTQESLEKDAESGFLYVIRSEGNCIASACLNEIQPACYDDAPWQDHAGRALIFHRLCVHPDWQGHGLGNRFISFADHLAAEQGFSSIRLDAYTGTPPVIALYERNGYRKIGYALHFPRRPLPFECMEKVFDRIRNAP